MLLLILNLVFAQVCSDQSEKIGDYRFSRKDLGQNLGCAVTIVGTHENPERRDFQFLQDGGFMVLTHINSLHKPISRSYYILPVESQLNVKSLGGLGVQVQDTSGLHWNFNEQMEISLEENCSLKVEKKLTPEGESTLNGQPGGFYLKKCPGSIIIDGGSFKGNDPFNKKTGVSEIRDSDGKSCKVNNSDLFTYIGKYDRSFKYKNSEKLYDFLSKHSTCKNLDLSPLTKKSHPANPKNNQ